MTVTSILKYTFLLHFIVAMVFGIWYLLAPQLYVDLVGWPYIDPAVDRMMGALMIGFGFSSFLGYRSDSWDRVEIIVLSEILWLPLAAIGIAVEMLAPGMPIIGWFNIGLLVLFFILFFYCYYEAKMKS